MRFRKAAQSARHICGLVLIPAALMARESGGGGAEKPGMDLWQWLNFAILAGLLAWLIAKQGGPLFNARSKQIQEGLAAGEKAKAEADAHAAEVQSKLANLEEEIAAMKSSAREEREHEAERIRREAQAEVARIHQQAEMEIESAGKQARLDVQRFAARLAVDLAEQKVRARMSPEAQSALLEGFINDLPDGAARAQSV